MSPVNDLLDAFLNALSVAWLIMITFLALPLPILADSIERALQEQGLTIEREVLPPPTARPTSPLYYQDGIGFEYPQVGVTSKINLLLQERYLYSDRSEQKNRSSFETEEARLTLSGAALYDEFRYQLETRFSPAPDSEQYTPLLEDTFIEWGPCTCSAIKLGNFQTPLGRQNNNREHLQQFADRSVAAQMFDLGLQPGALGSYDIVEHRLIATGSIFNGLSSEEGRSFPGSDTKHLALAALRWNSSDSFDIRAEGDFKWNEAPVISTAITYGYHEFESEELIGFDSARRHLLNYDLSLKSHGASFHGELFLEDSAASSEEADDPIGFYVQVGYFIVPRRFEIAARYSQSECGSSPLSEIQCSQGTVHQGTSALNYYLWRENLKLQLNYDHIRGEENERESRWLLQGSLYI